MHVTFDDAILLDVKEKSFKGRDKKDVTFRQARLLDNDNNYHQVTVDKDCEFPDNTDPLTLNRVKCTVVVDMEEQTNNGQTKLRKRLISVI